MSVLVSETVSQLVIHSLRHLVSQSVWIYSSLEANCDWRKHRQADRKSHLYGARATALPKKCNKVLFKKVSHNYIIVLLNFDKIKLL